jgi:hypothetical protein
MNIATRFSRCRSQRVLVRSVGSRRQPKVRALMPNDVPTSRADRISAFTDKASETTGNTHKRIITTTQARELHPTRRALFEWHFMMATALERSEPCRLP